MADGKIIAFSGAHGTGKSTAVYDMAARLKKETAGEIGVILEVARRCPLPIYSRDFVTTRESQMWVFCEQIRAEIEAVEQYDIVVSDRTIVDAIAYSSAAGFADLAFAMKALALHHVKVYDQVIFLGIADNQHLVDDGFRNTDMKLQKEVELRMLELYARLGIFIKRYRHPG